MNEDFGELGEVVATTLRDGRRVSLDVTSEALTIVVGNERHDLTYPDRGYAGHGFVVSADESWLVFWFHSGQSHVGYELFRLGPLHHAASFPYVLGEGLPPVLSPDSRYLAMAWATNPSLSILDEEDPETVDEIEWARLQVVELLPNLATTCRLVVRLAEDSPSESDDNYYIEDLHFVGEQVAFTTKWGRSVSLPVKLPKDEVIDGPPSRPMKAGPTKGAQQPGASELPGKPEGTGNFFASLCKKLRGSR
jgi:hypothetical protein